MAQQEEAEHLMQAKPGKEHRWLQQLVGEWTYEHVPDKAAGSGSDSVKHTGTESVRSLGDLWVIGTATGGMPDGSQHTSQITLGFDVTKKKFVGSWVGTMMAMQWIYEGELDAAEKVLTLSSQGPSMSGDGSVATYHDIIELTGPDTRTLTARAENADRSWTHLMTMRYVRKR